MSGPGRSSCDEVLRRLDDFVDHALGAGELRRVEAHLAECPACAEPARFERSLIQGIRTRLRRIVVPAGLREAIHTRLITETSQGNGEADLPSGEP